MLLSYGVDILTDGYFVSSQSTVGRTDGQTERPQQKLVITELDTR